MKTLIKKIIKSLIPMCIGEMSFIIGSASGHREIPQAPSFPNIQTFMELS